ncbi:hypothetical protein DFH06DRAFT_1338400 [Mycena polygramma]|nr:hypothetical protein DFH06DRAFT_1338400 [Mycena polygramma]
MAENFRPTRWTNPDLTLVSTCLVRYPLAAPVAAPSTRRHALADRLSSPPPTAPPAASTSRVKIDETCYCFNDAAGCRMGDKCSRNHDGQGESAVPAPRSPLVLAAPRHLAPRLTDPLHSIHALEASTFASCAPLPPPRPNTSISFPVARPSSSSVAGPLSACVLAYLLRDYPDRFFVQSLVNICNYGAAIGYAGPRVGRAFTCNLPATPSEHAATADDISASFRLGELRRVDDLSEHLKSRVFYSPIGSVPKAGGGCRCYIRGGGD